MKEEIAKQVQVYAYNNTQQILQFAQTEKVIYGSSRLGTNFNPIPLFASQNSTQPVLFITHNIGLSTYELTNHLGNVLSVISDKPIPHSSNGTTVDYWLAEVRQATDYSPFGVQLQTRNLFLTVLGNVPYRYGYQGSERDDEVKGSGNSYTTEFRQLDPRLGRWLSIDPKTFGTPWESPYASMGGNPILCNDVLGDKWKVGTDDNTKKDVSSLTKSKNEKYVKIGEDGNVSLDFGDLSENKINKILEKDEGLSLIKNLVDADENYFYSTSPDFNSRGLKENKEDFVANGGSEDIYNSISSRYLKNKWAEAAEVDFTRGILYKNASETTYGKNSTGDLVPTVLPQADYNGQVGLAAGNIIYTYSSNMTDPVTGKTTKITSSENVRVRLLKHELYENYLRTTKELPYLEAHEQANKKFYGEFDGTLILRR